MKKVGLLALTFWGACLLTPCLVFAAYNDVTLTTSTVLSVDGIEVDVTGSSAAIESIVVNTSSFDVHMQSGSSVTMTALSRNELNTTTVPNIAQSATCTDSTSSLTLTGIGAGVVTVTPSSTLCTTPVSTGSSSGGGGGGWTPPPPTAPTGGFSATASASASAGKQTITFNFGSDVTKIAIADNSGFAPASYINAASSVEWPSSDTGTLFVKFCNTYNVCSNPVEVSAASSSSSSSSSTGTSTTRPNVLTLSYIRNLTMGDTGDDVMALQQFLIANGYTISAGATGYFGNETRVALVAYQKANGINPPVGYFGSLTQASVMSTSQTTTSTVQTATSTPVYKFTRNLSLGESGSDVLALQKYLNENGFTVAQSGPGSSGHETSYFGSATSAALVKFQDAHSSDILAPFGLSHGTGYFGPSTVAFISKSQ